MSAISIATAVPIYHNIRHLDLVGQGSAAQCFSVGLRQKVVADECPGSAGVRGRSER